MADYRELITYLADCGANPKKTIIAAVSETGKELFGCFPLHTPEELVYAAGYLPVGLWGGKTEFRLSEKYLQGFCCTIAKTNLEFGINGTYKDLRGVIIPTFCDTLKCISENWIYACPDIPVIPIAYPHMRNTPEGLEYCVAEFKHVQEQLEKISGHSITEEQIEEAFCVYEDYRSVMRELVQMAADYPLTLDAVKRHLIIKAGFFMDKRTYTVIVREIMSGLKKQIKENAKLRVLATGILSEPIEVLAILKENGIAIVGDDLSQESRIFRTISRQNGSALEKMAGRIADGCGDTFLFEPEKQKGALLKEEALKKKADGIIWFQMKFCDPEEFDYPLVKKELEEAGIPLLYLEVDQQMDSMEQLRTRIQTFAEIL